MDNLWVVVLSAAVALVIGGIAGYSLAYFRLRRLEERWRSFVTRHKHDAEIAQGRATELANRLEAVQSGAETGELQTALDEAKRELAKAEGQAALLKPEVDALHRLLTEKEQEILLLKESIRESAGPTAIEGSTRQPVAEPVIEVEDEVPEIVATPEADPVLPPPTELPPEFAPPLSTVPSAVEEAARLNGEVEDDLTAISGIGPATARRLRHEGLTSFAQIAELNEEAIDEIAPKLKNRAERIRRDRWVEQARKLAAERAD